MVLFLCKARIAPPELSPTATTPTPSELPVGNTWLLQMINTETATIAPITINDTSQRFLPNVIFRMFIDNISFYFLAVCFFRFLLCNSHKRFENLINTSSFLPPITLNRFIEITGSSPGMTKPDFIASITLETKSSRSILQNVRPRGGRASPVGRTKFIEDTLLSSILNLQSGGNK